MAVNFNDPADVIDAVAKIAITQALDHIPVVGGILSAVVEAIWPESTPNYPTADEIFDELKDRIAGMIGTAISQNDVAILQQSLADIGDVIKDYQNADNNDALTQFISTKTTIDGKLNDFKLKGQEAVLLPLYVQAMNAYFSFLRDGLIACPNWIYQGTGNAKSKYVEILKDLNASFVDAQKYVQATYAMGLKAVTPSPPLSGFEQFNKVNDYVREMTLSVLDYVELWPYFFPDKYPNGFKHTYTREIYAPAQGWNRKVPINLPSLPSGPIKRVSYDDWITGSGDHVVHQLRVDYDTNSGPGGKSSTGLMGHASATADLAVQTVIDGVAIVSVAVWAGEIIDGMQLTGAWNGQPYTGPMHGSTGHNPQATLAYPSHHVSSVWLHGDRTWNNAVLPDVVVVGFKMDNH